MVSIDNYLSHPDKKLSAHIQGVVKSVEGMTSSKVAKVAAIFHDMGKLNPNFQKNLQKIFGET